MTAVMNGIAVADCGNNRVLGSPWQLWKSGDATEGLTRNLPDATVIQFLNHGCSLSTEAQQKLLAVHEVGHAFAMHAVGMAYGGITINSSPELLKDRPDLHELAHTERRELPRTAREVAMLTLSGWIASETWLELTIVEGRKLRDDPLNICHVQWAARKDHYDLMCFPTPRLTAYLYGKAQAPENWQGDVISIEAVREDMATMLFSRWPQVIKLAERVLTDDGATVETITEALGDPGWAS